MSRSSKSRSSMRSEYASSPTRGSRLEGLLSMIITKVSRSALLEHERVAKRRSAAKIPPKALRAFLRIRNRTCGQGRSGRHHVPAFRTPAMFQELADKLPSKLLAPRSFGRLVAEERRT